MSDNEHEIITASTFNDIGFPILFCREKEIYT